MGEKGGDDKKEWKMLRDLILSDADSSIRAGGEKKKKAAAREAAQWIDRTAADVLFEKKAGDRGLKQMFFFAFTVLVGGPPRLEGYASNCFD